MNHTEVKRAMKEADKRGLTGKEWQNALIPILMEFYNEGKPYNVNGFIKRADGMDEEWAEMVLDEYYDIENDTD